jgi:hypothetical protein
MGVSSLRLIISVSLTETATISFKYLHSYSHEGECDLSQTNYFSQNLVALGIETETSGSVARSSEH